MVLPAPGEGGASAESPAPRAPLRRSPDVTARESPEFTGFDPEGMLDCYDDGVVPSTGVDAAAASVPSAGPPAGPTNARLDFDRIREAVCSRIKTAAQRRHQEAQEADEIFAELEELCPDVAPAGATAARKATTTGTTHLGSESGTRRARKSHIVTTRRTSRSHDVARGFELLSLV